MFGRRSTQEVGSGYVCIRTRSRAGLAMVGMLVSLALIAPSQPAAADDEATHADVVESCSTAKRANGDYVTRVWWESGRKVRRVNLTARTRLFPGVREMRSPSPGKADPRVVSCGVAFKSGSVVVRTKSRARYAFVTPPPVETAPTTETPALWARWQTPIVVSVAGLDASWKTEASAAAWSMALPAGRGITVTDAPCAELQAGCIPARIEDLTGVQSPGPRARPGSVGRRPPGLARRCDGQLRDRPQR